MPEPLQITPREVKQRLDTGEKLRLVDVREPFEFQQARIEGSELIPMRSVPQALASLDVNKRTEIAHEMQMIDYNEGGYIIPFFPAVIDGYSPSVNGIVKSKLGASLNSWDFEHMWLS